MKVNFLHFVTAGFGGHSCLLVDTADYRIPENATGAVLGSDDTWLGNNHAQKNVDRYEALKSSPYNPIEFEFSVRNEGSVPEMAYREPEGLPAGMTLHVSPTMRQVRARSTARFRCRLELDDEVIPIGEEKDPDLRFRLHAWRQAAESCTRWGGVEYEVRPRHTTQMDVDGEWDYDHIVHLTGEVFPDAYFGRVVLRVDLDDEPPAWFETPVNSNGRFEWLRSFPPDSRELTATAWFQADAAFGSSRALPVRLISPYAT